MIYYIENIIKTGVACQQGTLTLPDTWYKVILYVKDMTYHIETIIKTGVACQKGTLTLPDTWFRPPLWDLPVLQLLR